MMNIEHQTANNSANDVVMTEAVVKETGESPTSDTWAELEGLLKRLERPTCRYYIGQQRQDVVRVSVLGQLLPSCSLVSRERSGGGV